MHNQTETGQAHTQAYTHTYNRTHTRARTNARATDLKAVKWNKVEAEASETNLHKQGRPLSSHLWRWLGWGGEDPLINHTIFTGPHLITHTSRESQRLHHATPGPQNLHSRVNLSHTHTHTPPSSHSNAHTCIHTPSRWCCNNGHLPVKPIHSFSVSLILFFCLSLSLLSLPHHSSVSLSLSICLFITCFLPSFALYLSISLSLSVSLSLYNKT